MPNDEHHSRPLTASVVITTKDRRDDLRSALRSCVEQTGVLETVIIDDGSTDGTSEMVAEEFPDVRIVRHERSTGLIVARNNLATLAKGDILFSIDDDAIFTSPGIVGDVLKIFDAPRVGAVAIPYIDVKKSPEVRQQAPDHTQYWVTDRYIGTAHAVRKALFLQLGGYRELFFHQGEERDFCARLLEAGYFVRLAHTAPIHHFESPKRDTTRMDLYGRRNDILFSWLNDHWTRLPIQLAGTSVNGALFGLRGGRPIRMLKGTMMGFSGIPKFWNHRQPISADTMRLFRHLQKEGSTLYSNAIQMRNSAFRSAPQS
ncbi:glycosyltransferase [bacterium]|nr:glycosyltransferase [bacterium]